MQKYYLETEDGKFYVDAECLSEAAIQLANLAATINAMNFQEVINSIKVSD